MKKVHNFFKSHALLTYNTALQKQPNWFIDNIRAGLRAKEIETEIYIDPEKLEYMEKFTNSLLQKKSTMDQRRSTMNYFKGLCEKTKYFVATLLRRTPKTTNETPGTPTTTP